MVRSSRSRGSRRMYSNSAYVQTAKIITDKLRALIAERDVRVHVVAPMTTDDNLQLGRKAVAAGERAYNALEHAQTLSELNRALKF